MSAAALPESRMTIRVEDLGQPIQELIRAMQAKGDFDLGLVEHIRVRDVARVLEAQSLGLSVCLTLSLSQCVSVSMFSFCYHLSCLFLHRWLSFSAGGDLG